MVRWLTVGLAILAGVGSAVFLFWPSQTVLEIATNDNGKQVFCARMRPGEEVVLSFIHSVNRRPVYDTIRVEPRQLVVVKSRFDSFGAGMPETSTAEGAFRVAADGWLEWTINRPMAEVVVRVGRVADHTLRVRGYDIPLAIVASPGTAVALRPRVYSRIDVWKGACLR